MKAFGWIVFVLGIITATQWFVVGLGLFCIGLIMVATIHPTLRDNLGDKLPNDLVVLDWIDLDRVTAFQCDQGLSCKWWRVGGLKEYAIVASQFDVPFAHSKPHDLGIDIYNYYELGRIVRVDDKLKAWSRVEGFYIITNVEPLQSVAQAKGDNK